MADGAGSCTLTPPGRATICEVIFPEVSRMSPPSVERALFGVPASVMVLAISVPSGSSVDSVRTLPSVIARVSPLGP